MMQTIWHSTGDSISNYNTISSWGCRYLRMFHRTTWLFKLFIASGSLTTTTTFKLWLFIGMQHLDHYSQFNKIIWPSGFDIVSLFASLFFDNFLLNQMKKTWPKTKHFLTTALVIAWQLSRQPPSNFRERLEISQNFFFYNAVSL